MISLRFVLLLALSYAATSTWQPLAPLTTPRSDFVSVIVGNYVYLMGGCSGNESELTDVCPSITSNHTRYNMLTNQWTTLSPAPRPRYRYMAAAVGNFIYYLGGRDLNDVIIQEVDQYNILTDTWTTLPDQHGVTNMSDGAAFVIGQKVYSTGGYTLEYASLSTTIVLDTTVTPLRFVTGLVPNKTYSAGDNGAVAIGNHGFVFGGYSSVAPYNFCAPLNTMEKYDPTTNTWQVLAPFLGSGRGDMAYAVIQSSIFIMGGETKDSACNVSVPVATVDIYSTITDTWVALSPLAMSKFRFMGAALPSQYLIFDFGGQDADAKLGFYEVLANVDALNVADSFPGIGHRDGASCGFAILLVLALCSIF